MNKTQIFILSDSENITNGGMTYMYVYIKEVEDIPQSSTDNMQLVMYLKIRNVLFKIPRICKNMLNSNKLTVLKYSTAKHIL